MYRIQLYVDLNGRFRWRLRAPDSQIIAVSGRGYQNRASARSAAEATLSQLRLVEIEDPVAA